MRTRILATLAALFATFLPVITVGQVSPAPSLMNFQGKLTKPDSTPVADGNYSVRFSLWTAATGGTEKWNQTLNPVTVRNGTFAVLLNVGTGPTDLWNDNRWLEIKIGTAAPLTPRQQLVSVAFALKANTVPDNAITNAKIANGTITANKFAANIFNPLAWLLGGNSGVTSGFLGTTDNQPLLFKANSQRVLQMQHVQNGDYLGNSLLGGYWLNSITNGVTGATVFGGMKIGTTESPNRVTDHGGTVGGGKNNRAGNDNATLDDAWLATVSGGAENTASGIAATVGGGASNTTSGDFATIGGGGVNTSSSLYATVGGGTGNTASGDFATVGGGAGNTASGYIATVGGGYANTASGFWTTVGGGNSNTAIFNYSTVAGGEHNTASGDYATVSGGLGNHATDTYATVGGGWRNDASSYADTVSGGTSNTASNGYATVGGGYANTASSFYATVPGGHFNTASGFASFAAGNRAKANHEGAFVWADNTSTEFASTAARQFNVRASGGVLLFTRSDLSTGVILNANDSSWNSVSDRNAKTAFQPVDTLDLLERLVAIPITTWHYKGVENPIRHIGPMAQDFFAAFKVGMDDKHIGTIDADGVALAAIQGLNRKLEAKERRLTTVEADNAAIKRDNAELQAKNAELEARLERLEAALRNNK